MRIANLIYLATGLVLTCHHQSVGAPVVVANSNVVVSPNTDFPPANYTAVVNQNNALDTTQAWFQLGGNEPTGYSFRLHTYLTDEGADWYWVDAGDLLSEQTIADGVWMDNLAFPFTQQTRPVATDFYLGIATGNIDSGPDQRDAYGWVHLQIVAGKLTMVENVMSYDSVGIIVGTSNAIPEPAALSLAAD